MDARNVKPHKHDGKVDHGGNDGNNHHFANWEFFGNRVFSPRRDLHVESDKICTVKTLSTS